MQSHISLFPFVPFTLPYQIMPLLTCWKKKKRLLYIIYFLKCEKSGKSLETITFKGSSELSSQAKTIILSSFEEWGKGDDRENRDGWFHNYSCI